MKCPNCGHENDNDSMFCEQCGAKLNAGGATKKSWLPWVICSVLICIVIVLIIALSGKSNTEIKIVETESTSVVQEDPVQAESSASQQVAQQEVKETVPAQEPEAKPKQQETPKPPKQSAASQPPKQEISIIEEEPVEDYEELDYTEFTDEDEEDVVYMIVETMPEFPGGNKALFTYLSENVKYPVIAQENGIQGKVTCQFTVNKDGSIVDVQVVRSGGDSSLDNEAVRVIQSMPKWNPGKRRGKPVRVRYTVPVNFKLQ